MCPQNKPYPIFTTDTRCVPTFYILTMTEHQPQAHKEALQQKRKLTRKGKDPNAHFVREKL